MNNKIFVGNLNFKVRGKELREHFEQFGEVEDATVILDRFDKRKSKGFGFITFITEASAQKAVDEANEKDFEGRPLTVNIAKPREERPAFEKKEEPEEKKAEAEPEETEDAKEEKTEETSEDAE